MQVDLLKCYKNKYRDGRLINHNPQGSASERSRSAIEDLDHQFTRTSSLKRWTLDNRWIWKRSGGAGHQVYEVSEATAIRSGVSDKIRKRSTAIYRWCVPHNDVSSLLVWAALYLWTGYHKSRSKWPFNCVAHTFGVDHVPRSTTWATRAI